MNGDLHTNGHVVQEDAANSVAESSSGHSVPDSNVYQRPRSHDEEIMDALYNAFNTGSYGDVMLHVRQNSYSLHTLLLSRSPTLAHLISTTPATTNNTQRTIVVDIEQEREITLEGFHIALGYLYSSVSMSSIREDNAKSVLAAASFLGGMDALAEQAYQVCRDSISVETIGQWLEFVRTVDSSSNDRMAPTSVFGPYAARLKDEIFNFLVSLPTTLGVSGDSETPEARATLLEIYALIPWDMFKMALESPLFRIGSDQQRFKFAKEVIVKRKTGIARGTEAEESVVLAFGQSGSGSVIHLTRKMKTNRKLWKVSS